MNSPISIGKIQHSLETENLEIFADPLLEKVCQCLFKNSAKHGEHVTRTRVWYTTTSDGVTIFFEDDVTGIPQKRRSESSSGDLGRIPGLGWFFRGKFLTSPVSPSVRPANRAKGYDLRWRC